MIPTDEHVLEWLNTKPTTGYRPEAVDLLKRILQQPDEVKDQLVLGFESSLLYLEIRDAIWHGRDTIPPFKQSGIDI